MAPFGSLRTFDEMHSEMRSALEDESDREKPAADIFIRSFDLKSSFQPIRIRNHM